MWRYQSMHKKRETEFLDHAIARVVSNHKFTGLADALIKGAAESEPIFSQSLQTPQDIRFHAEGPFLHSHIRLMLTVLYAIQAEELHLIDLEEFRRLKGYEGETDELEETLKEYIGLMEAFALCHDIAKWETVVFEAKKGSRGEELGFSCPLTYAFDTDAVNRVNLRDAYTELFHEFSKAHPDETSTSIQKRFYQTYGIDLHYPHHDSVMMTSVYRSLLERFARAHELTDRDARMLEDLIQHHMDAKTFFTSVRPKKIAALNRFAQKRGYDADDFLDLLQACVFLDKVCGSMEMTPNGSLHNPSLLIDFLRSEHQYAPDRRRQKILERECEEKKSHNRIFQKVGLDGVALLELFNMDPGPEFGNLLRRIQSAILGQGEMPVLQKEIKKEMEKRVCEFYNELFVKGE